MSNAFDGIDDHIVVADALTTNHRLSISPTGNQTFLTKRSGHNRTFDCLIIMAVVDVPQLDKF